MPFSFCILQVICMCLEKSAKKLTSFVARGGVLHGQAKLCKVSKGH